MVVVLRATTVKDLVRAERLHTDDVKLSVRLYAAEKFKMAATSTSREITSTGALGTEMLFVRRATRCSRLEIDSVPAGFDLLSG